MPICGSSNIRTPSTRARSERRRFSLELQVFLLNFLTLLFVRSRKGHRRSDVLPHCSLELLDVRRCPASTKLTEHVVNLLPASHQVLLRLLLDETRLQVVTATELSKLLQRILYGTHPLLRLVCRRLIQWRWNGSRSGGRGGWLLLFRGGTSNGTLARCPGLLRLSSSRGSSSMQRTAATTNTARR